MRPVSIANCSGFYGDRHTAPSEMLRRIADESLFTSSLITLSNVRVVYNRFRDKTYREQPNRHT